MRMTPVRVFAAILAIALLAVPASADAVLGNVSKSVRVTATNRGSTRAVTLRATTRGRRKATRSFTWFM